MSSNHHSPEPMPSNHTTACQAARDLLGAYSVGATTPAESRFVEAMLSQCPGLAQELEDYLEIESVLRHSVPDTEPPPPVENLLAKINAPQEVAAPASTPAKSAPLTKTVTAALPTRTATDPTAPTSEELERLRSKLRALPAKSTPAANQGRPWRTLTIATLLAAALALTNVWWYRQVEDLRTTQQKLAAQIEAQRLEIGTMSRRIDLFATTTDTAAPHALVTWDLQSEVGSVYAANFPPLPEGMVYRLWALDGDQPVALGHFRPHDDGSGTFIFHSQQPLETFDKMGISTETPTDTAHPTRPHLVVGDV